MFLQVQFCDLSSENFRCGQFNLQLIFRPVSTQKVEAVAPEQANLSV